MIHWNKGLLARPGSPFKQYVNDRQFSCYYDSILCKMYSYLDKHIEKTVSYTGTTGSVKPLHFSSKTAAEYFTKSADLILV
jgi:hypothetical protein